MTLLKFSPDENSKVKDKEKEAIIKELDKKDNYYICLHENRIQACAWILLTIGLCVIVTTFYLAIEQKSYNTNSESVDGETNVSDNNIKIEDIIISGKYGEVGAGKWMEDNENGSIIKHNIFESIVNNLNGCQETLCQIACSNAENIYSSLYDSMKSGTCSSIDVLLLERQDFPFKILKNKWHPLNRTIHEVIIRSSNIAKIKSDAFNAPIFVNTILMSWSRLTIDKIESGALLGLYKLKYLNIDSDIKVLEPSFFQPVQTTLTHLKLNGNLLIPCNHNFFGVSIMTKLEYLDLSFNRFKGIMDKKFLISTPNLKYLIMVDSQLSYIDPNAFEHLSEKLVFVNLAKNQLTTLTAEVIRPLLFMQNTVLISLSDNDWKCDCELQDLAEVYRKFRIQFMDAVYCKAPHNLYGVSIDEVKFENCKVPSSSAQETIEEKEVDTEMNFTPKTTTARNGDRSGTDSTSDSGEEKSAETIFKMRCFNADSSSSPSSSSSSSSAKSSELELLRRNLEASASDLDYIQFPAPEHEFELFLITDNNTVIITVEKANALMIIWFSEQSYDDMSFSSEPFDYTCMSYQAPSLVVGPLMDNTTYTFCLIPYSANEISPFNCLPLHVPHKKEENIWISQDDKEFTIGMLCLIFLVSTIAGALIAYYGIKSYPDLLEGSKNVLIVKKPDPACYVSTISETEYQKQSSMKKKKASISHSTPLKKQTSSIKLPLPASPKPETPPPPFHMSVKDLERLSSNASTCFEDKFPDYPFQDDNYETPKVYGNEYTIEQRCVPNKYGMSPGSPPPLPKRNSNIGISENHTVVINRFSSKLD